MPWAPFRFTTHMPFSCRFYMFLLLFSAAKESQYKISDKRSHKVFVFTYSQH